jgi:hypothetical protein
MVHRADIEELENLRNLKSRTRRSDKKVPAKAKHSGYKAYKIASIRAKELLNEN